MPSNPDLLFVQMTPNEEIAYVLDVTARNPNSAAVASTSVTLYDKSGNDLTATKTSGSVSVSGNNITMPSVLTLVAGSNYDLQAIYTIGSNKFETVVRIECKKRGFV